MPPLDLAVPAPITCNEDLRQAARRRVPKALFDYVDRGAYTEATLRANRSDLDAIALRQRVMVDVSRRHLGCTLVGEPARMPVALAPTGLAGLLHGQGEVMAARAAQACGLPFTLSTMSIASIEQVRAAVSRPFWFQLYVMKDRAFVRALIERARAAECPVLMLTVDQAAQAQRHQDLRNGLSVPPRLSLGHALDMARKPRWCAQMLRSPGRSFGNLEGFVKGAQGVQSLGQWIGGQFDASLCWRDVGWVRDLWPGKLVIKGILDAEDAAQAVAHGADAIVVSNHGGRQLDGTVSTVAALPSVVAEVGARCEVLVDGGIRTGQDVLKALALGAHGTLVGRAFLYGLAANGQAGVQTALGLMQRELDVSMALCGLRDVAEVGPQALWQRA
jgi:L-lactate dehydrogenase (cytochrome)